ncbi:MAG: hypothetical protein V2A55_00080 [Candidatus Jorgensenbacteria bacterium]
MRFLIDTYQWFVSLPWKDAFFGLRWILIVLNVFLLVLFVFVFVKALEYRPHFLFNPKPRKRSPLKDRKLRERWQMIIKKAGNAPPQSLTLAVIEADGFVDDVLKKMDLPGEHMADRLERLGRLKLKTADRLWRAHRIRNDLVHTPGFVLPPADAKSVLGDYEAFLLEIGLLT